MSDPAVEAARTAWRAELPLVPAEHFVGQTPPRNLTRAAREALKPIRDLFEDLNSASYVAISLERAEGIRAALRELAPLIYTTEELAG